MQRNLAGGARSSGQMRQMAEVGRRRTHCVVESKLNLFREILFQECKERFGKISIKQTAAQKGKGRREKEIDQLVQRRRQLRRNWRKATAAEKEVLWEEVKQRLASLWRAKQIRKRRKRKEMERANFFKNPFKHARQLLEDKKSGKLGVIKEELEQHIKGHNSEKARAASVRTEWDTVQAVQILPQVAVFIPKEQDSKAIGQFRSIALLNVEGKIFTVMARRMTSYLMENAYIDTSCQKAGVPGCVEHSTIIWKQIQKAKLEKSDLHVVWLDLANA
ncbi:hypothetical protein SKAU_G00236970 [Synaphobranchus kaupii]|uniref:Uncharacterized protein n=1 Tax=Synaphobranchus kaupii TaxID=118154 RepID=A0A9Q1F759_SYNKA|nr:hypothetical protein SKAU_G00236970 [Synaphobranchus kaupii]